jgi:hypothetical protein
MMVMSEGITKVLHRVLMCMSLSLEMWVFHFISPPLFSSVIFGRLHLVINVQDWLACLLYPAGPTSYLVVEVQHAYCSVAG